MSHSIEHQLSIEDSQLIEANKLGTPLAIYKLRPVYTRVMYICTVIVLILSIILLIFLFIITVTGWYQIRTGNTMIFATSIVMPVFGILLGLLILYTDLPHVKQAYIVICERGFLQVGKKSLGKHVDVLRWEDIHTIDKKFIRRDYFITCREGKMFVLSSYYQDVEELLIFISERIGIV